jgi:hypothetical protein
MVKTVYAHPCWEAPAAIEYKHEFAEKQTCPLREHEKLERKGSIHQN